MTTFEQAKKTYNRMMNDFCLEHLTIGTSFSENTENWNLRDLVSEAQYQLDVCYEEGNLNEEGRYPDYWPIDENAILNKERYDRIIMHNENEKEMHKEWVRKIGRLKRFINKYKTQAMKMKPFMGHCSNFD